MISHLYDLCKFKYHDIDRCMFVTEENDRYIAGYQISEDDVSKCLDDMRSTFGSGDEKTITETNKRYKGTYLFKKYLKEKVQKWY